MQRKDQLYLALTAIGTAVLCHLFFSPYGFNPTDDGFVLSSSIRLLHGQIPHVDFSSLRPLGYACLHIPELLISREHTFLISRFVFWLEISAIAYVWTQILFESTKYDMRSTKFISGAFLFFITFIFNAHYFPIAVLHTIDGLLFALIGFYVLLRTEKYGWLGGLFIGYAILCKQGYAVLIPVLMWMFPKQKSAWISSLIPGILYVAVITACGGWKDLLEQLTAHQEILEVGILNYMLNPWFFGGIILSWGSRKIKLNPFLSLTGLLIFQTILLVSAHYHGQGLMLLFGYTLSESFFDKVRKRQYFLALAMAWCVSISVGYASIALFSGGLTALLLVQYADYEKRYTGVFRLGLFLLLIISSVYVRSWHIYRDSPRPQLTRKLDGIVEGAAGIYTNERTYSVLKELDSLQQANPGLLVLPDFTACQLYDYERPILTEWPNRAEVPNSSILAKVTARLETDNIQTVAVARYQTARLADTLITEDFRDYRIIQYVSDRFTLRDSSRFFRLYVPK